MMFRSTHLALAAIAPLLALPAAALAQASQTPAAAATAGVSPVAPHAVPGSTAAQRVEQHIRELHAQLRITPGEQPEWEQFADVMRANAGAMDQLFAERMQKYPTMNAVQNMQSYAQIAETHAEHVQSLVPAFTKLYDAMPEQQQQLTDRVFRVRAENRAQAGTQTGRTEIR
jgi:periplasmic protein CpxP/Spy